MKMTESPNGDKSSKRIMGIVLLSLGMALLVTLFFLAVFTDVKDSDTAEYCVMMLITSGSGLLGLGIADHFAVKKKEEK